MTAKFYSCAIPTSFDPALNGEFKDWCTENGIASTCTRVFAEDEEWDAFSFDDESFYHIWLLFADDDQMVALSLRWSEIMLDTAKWSSTPRSRIDEAILSGMGLTVSIRI